MNIHWTDTAIQHLSAIHDYIAFDSEEYARRMVDRLTKRSEQIGNSPYSGRSVPEFNDNLIREIIEGQYRIIYYIKEEQIDVLAVIHGARLFSEELIH
ncbi:MAG TPA: type II toxin-antitoxin system RelE/ParE family toxin [Candidatus Deferrimicrobium sp.]|nr:type II toxin-antitoxin system RelE/ParE family toxin [Candidatus Deferrimicrobium sp.]